MLKKAGWGGAPPVGDFWGGGGAPSEHQQQAHPLPSRLHQPALRTEAATPIPPGDWRPPCVAPARCRWKQCLTPRSPSESFRESDGVGEVGNPGGFRSRGTVTWVHPGQPVWAW